MEKRYENFSDCGFEQKLRRKIVVLELYKLRRNYVIPTIRRLAERRELVIDNSKQRFGVLQ